MNNPFSKLVLKIFVTGIILSLLFSYIDVKHLKQHLLSASIHWVIVGIVLGFVLTVIAAWRWMRINSYLNSDLPFKLCVTVYFEAVMFNIFLPGSVGGEVIRVIRASRVNGKLRESIFSVFFDRAANLGAIVLMVLVFLPTLVINEETTELMWIVISLMTVSGILFVVFLALPYMKSFRRYRLLREALRISFMFRRIFFHRARLLEVVILSLGIQVFSIGILYVGGLAIGLYDLSIGQLAIVTMLGMLSNTVPISFGGLGVREGAMVWALMQFGVNQVEAYSLAFLFGFMFICQGFPGALFWVTKTVSDYRKQSTIIEKNNY